jgi:hypothetical protein
MRTSIAGLGALLAAVATAAAALTTGIPAAGLPSASQYSATLLPEREGIVPWRKLAGVEPVKEGGRMQPRFSPEILGLDRKTVKLQGFIVPLDMGDRQKRFLLTATPPHCSFCLPAGPDAIVEVVAKTAVKYGFDPIVMEGRFLVLKDDPNGLLYQLVDAESRGPAQAVPAAAPSAPAPVVRLPAPTR